MEHTHPTNARRGLRFFCGVIAFLIFGYLAEIFLMGAPDFRRNSHHSYDREKEPVLFWTQFTAFAVVGVSAAYLSFNWKKGRYLFGMLEERDRKMLEAMGEKKAVQYRRSLELRVVGLGLGLLVALGLLVSLLI